MSCKLADGRRETSRVGESAPCWSPWRNRANPTTIPSTSRGIEANCGRPSAQWSLSFFRLVEITPEILRGPTNAPFFPHRRSMEYELIAGCRTPCAFQGRRVLQVFIFQQSGSDSVPPAKGGNDDAAHELPRSFCSLSRSKPTTTCPSITVTGVVI